MKTFQLFFVCMALLVNPAYSFQFFPPENHPDGTKLAEVIMCEMNGVLYRFAGELRDRKISVETAKKEILSFAKRHPKEAVVDIVNEVYGKYKNKSPGWLEGFVYGICLSMVPIIEPEQEETSIPKKKQKSLM